MLRYLEMWMNDLVLEEKEYQRFLKNLPYYDHDLSGLGFNKQLFGYITGKLLELISLLNAI